MITFWTPLAMAVVNEFRMQWRRRAMWFAVIVASGIFPLLAWKTLNDRWTYEAATRAVADWTSFLNHTAPIAYGIVLADRLPRDRRLHVDELLDSFPAGLGCRLWGKALGALAATLVPFLLIALAGVGYIAVHLHTASALWLGLEAIVTINLPALLFIAAVCLLLSTVIWTPAVGFLCAGIWVWVQLDPSQNPALGNTLLSPYGDYAIAGIFGSDRGFAGRPGSVLHLGPLMPTVSAAAGVLGVLLVAAMALVMLGALPAAARRRPT